ncbi:hypothetical protein Pan44_16500 [Caulifigura coniformis]|uniref:Thioredoxin domain-containing protein n=1 Tax=Caulifigura coniformis TaxID=2527983 RepID=A0A517SBW6_9PLAN|nr:thioredoxin family protein [Caulifigura coniformis]QDT53627.1 hypothetical protein Pan44_16500 [Caulifigura coniformis]
MKLFVCIGLCLAACMGCDGDQRSRIFERDPILDAPPIPDEVLERVLADPEAVPRRESTGTTIEQAIGTLGERLGIALSEAATEAPAAEASRDQVRVVLVTADWCTWCKPAKDKAIPWLTSMGYKVEIVDVTRQAPDGLSFVMPRSLPAWVFFRNGREVYRQEGGSLPEHLAAAVKKVPPVVSPPAVSAWFGPTLRVADALPLVAGVSLKLGSAATVSVPANLKWTVSQKPGSVVLSFDPAPQVTVHKVLNWRVRLEGIEITPTSVSLQIDNLPDVTVKLDWSFPTRSSGTDIDAADDLHRAAAPLRPRPDRPVLRFIGRSVLFAYRVCTVASFLLVVV